MKMAGDGGALKIAGVESSVWQELLPPPLLYPDRSASAVDELSGPDPRFPERLLGADANACLHQGYYNPRGQFAAVEKVGYFLQRRLPSPTFLGDENFLHTILELVTFCLQFIQFFLELAFSQDFEYF